MKCLTEFTRHIQEQKNYEFSNMFHNNLEILQPVPVQIFEENSVAQEPHVKIIEQPSQKPFKFRYKCEGRSAPVQGKNSGRNQKTYPEIQVVGYHGASYVVVSCVTKEEPYRPHPHKIVGRDGCIHGVCKLDIPADSMTIKLPNLSIECTKIKDIEHELHIREKIKVDPFKTGFSHKKKPKSFDFSSLRLCFQVFLVKDDARGRITTPLQPVVSEPIFNKNAVSELVIMKLSECCSYVDGPRKEIILLCDRVTKDDIQIHFYEEDSDGDVIWESLGDFKPSQVHKNVAISFIPPPYHNVEISEPAKVFVQLRRPSDGTTSEPLPFQYLPVLKKSRKRVKFDSILRLNEELGLHTNDEVGIQGDNKMSEADANKFYALDTTFPPHVPSSLTTNIPSTSTTVLSDTTTCDSYFDMISKDRVVPPRLPLIRTSQVSSFLSTTIPSTSTEFLSDMAVKTSSVLHPSSTTFVTTVDTPSSAMSSHLTLISTALSPSSSHAWNLPYTQNIETNPSHTVKSDVNLGGIEGTGLKSLLNLDTHNTELKQIDLNSGELGSFEDIDNLSDVLNTNLSLTDVEDNSDQNMSDSFTKLVNNTLKDVCQETNVFN